MNPIVRALRSFAQEALRSANVEPGLDPATGALWTRDVKGGPFTLSGSGNGTSGASAQVATGQSGPGVLEVTNLDGAAAVYLAAGTASASTYLLGPGATVSWPLADVSTVQVFGTGAAFTWAVLGWA